MAFWKNISIERKIYGVVGVMALLVAMELFTLLFAMNTLSTLRAFVGGEGLWSKAQKTAVQSLQKYAFTHQYKDYQTFLDSLRVPMGDRKARQEMLKPNPDERIIFEGFVEGRIHPADIPGLINLFRRFHKISYIENAIKVWTEADLTINELSEIGNDIHAHINSQLPRHQLGLHLDRLEVLDRKLTKLEDEFSYILGAGSRWLERLLMISLIITVLIVESTGLMLTFFFGRNLGKSLKEMNLAANEIERGQFDSQVPVRSRDELGQLAEAINKMARGLRENIGVRQQAESANHLKSIFLANMSHEIRTPLSAILGFTELLKSSNVTEKEKKDYLDIIERTGKSLTQIIDDILDLSKVEAGRLEIVKKDFCIEDVLSESINTLKVRAESKGLTLSFEKRGQVPRVIRTDPLRLRQILMNLISNAIKFTEVGHVEIRVESSPSFLLFSVADTGIGISAEARRSLFHFFSQGDISPTRRYQGTGLGLALSRRLANSLGGDIVLSESHMGKGSTFVLSLPLEVAELASGVDQVTYHKELPASASQEPLKNLKILVIDDSLDNQLLLQKILTLRGAQVAVANNGLEGLAKALSGNVDVVLMDMQMPVKDGYQATQELRERGFQSPIIAVTAHAMKEDRDRCMDAGCDDYITKPIYVNDLLRTLSKHIRPAVKEL